MANISSPSKATTNAPSKWLNGNVQDASPSTKSTVSTSASTTTSAQSPSKKSSSTKQWAQPAISPAALGALIEKKKAEEKEVARNKRLDKLAEERRIKEEETGGPIAGQEVVIYKKSSCEQKGVQSVGAYLLESKRNSVKGGKK